MVSYAIPYEKAVSDRPCDGERTRLRSYLPTPKAQGRPRNHSLRDVLDAIFYVLKSGGHFLIANTEPALEQEGL